ncbi:hypothetical protein BQ8420_15665 [Nocardiopsis sp. JB363]|nr:hypothetical protein BQ8420_15665 [Nocardiopsis sp. JB363]
MGFSAPSGVFCLRTRCPLIDPGTRGHTSVRCSGEGCGVHPTHWAWPRHRERPPPAHVDGCGPVGLGNARTGWYGRFDIEERDVGGGRAPQGAAGAPWVACSCQESTATSLRWVPCFPP